MARSKKNSPFTGMTTAESEKGFKRLAHKQARMNAKARLRNVGDPEDDLVFEDDLYGDPWSGPKDGKCYLGENADPKILRK
jgi:hypothetical protein